LIYSRLGEDPGLYAKQVEGYLCQAIRLGVDPEKCRKSFRSLMDTPAVQEALAQAGTTVSRSPADQLVDPLADQPFPFRKP
jgi:hypothetical protein